MSTSFGKLTKKNNHKYDIKRILNKDTLELEFLFKNSRDSLEKLTVVEAERRIALDNLRKLTLELQSKRLDYNSKSSYKYFSL